MNRGRAKGRISVRPGTNEIAGIRERQYGYLAREAVARPERFAEGRDHRQGRRTANHRHQQGRRESMNPRTILITTPALAKVLAYLQAIAFLAHELGKESFHGRSQLAT